VLTQEIEDLWLGPYLWKQDMLAVSALEIPQNQNICKQNFKYKQKKLT